MSRFQIVSVAGAAVICVLGIAGFVSGSRVSGNSVKRHAAGREWPFQTAARAVQFRLADSGQQLPVVRACPHVSAVPGAVVTSRTTQ